MRSETNHIIGSDSIDPNAIKSSDARRELNRLGLLRNFMNTHNPLRSYPRKSPGKKRILTPQSQLDRFGNRPAFIHRNRRIAQRSQDSLTRQPFRVTVRLNPLYNP